MSCLNTPSVLNSLEQKILDSVSADVSHVAIVGAGDGKLARAIKEKAGADVKLSLVEPRKALHGYLEDLGGAETEAWDLSWYEAQAKDKGPIDSLILYQIHEYWEGNVFTLGKMTELLSDKGTVWVSYLNCLSRRMMEHSMPPRQVNFSALTHPVRLFSSMDYASWNSYLPMLNAQLESVWGMLDKDALEFCQKQEAKQVDEPPVWEFHGMKLNVRTVADALLWGGTFIGMQFSIRKEGEQPKAPQIFGAAYSPHLYQALLLPYPEATSDESEKLRMEVEIKQWKLTEDPKLAPVVEFFLNQIEVADQVKTVLLVGAGWGKDLLLLQKKKNEWEWTGVESEAYKVEAGQELLPEGVALKAFTPGEPLPFDDASFDLVISLGYCSTVYPAMGEAMCKEMLRVANRGVYHMEDGRGPEASLALKQYSLQDVYGRLGYESVIQPVLVKGQQTGAYIVKLNK